MYKFQTTLAMDLGTSNLLRNTKMSTSFIEFESQQTDENQNENWIKLIYQLID